MHGPASFRTSTSRFGAGIGPCGLRFGDEFQSRIAGKPPGDIAPERVDLGAVFELERDVRSLGRTDEHRDLGAVATP